MSVGGNVDKWCLIINGEGGRKSSKIVWGCRKALAELVSVEGRRNDYKQVFYFVRNTSNSPEMSKKR